jgi:hypothetical protein
MTEIKIEKKSPAWPWFLLVLGIIAAIWFLFLRTDDATPLNVAEKTELIDKEENNAVVNSYVDFINSNPTATDLDHEFSSEAIIKLTAAVNAMAADVDYDIKMDSKKVIKLAQDIKKDFKDTNHSDAIRQSADILNAALQNLHQAKYPTLSLEAYDVKNATLAINPDIMTLDQRDSVKLFFGKASILLDKMN